MSNNEELGCQTSERKPAGSPVVVDGSMFHVIKAWTRPFQELVDGRSYTVRRTDRHYEVGDAVLIREVWKDSDRATGRAVLARVSFVTDDTPPCPLPEGVAVLGLDVVGPFYLDGRSTDSATSIHHEQNDTNDAWLEPIDVSDWSVRDMQTAREYRKTATVHAVKIYASFKVETLNGIAHAEAGDYLCEGPTGDKWPVKESIFEAQYTQEQAPTQILVPGDHNQSPTYMETRRAVKAFIERGTWTGEPGDTAEGRESGVRAMIVGIRSDASLEAL